MPKVSSQSPPRPAPKTPARGGGNGVATRPAAVTSRPAPGPGRRSAWDLTEYLRVLLYGQSGTGKTTLWSTFPGPILALICSGGRKPGELLSVDTPELRRKIEPYVVGSVEEMKDYLRYAADPTMNFQTIVLDHVSGFQDLVLKEVLNVDELPAQKSWGMAQQQQWGQTAAMVKDLIRVMLNLPMNCVIIGQERTFGAKEENSGDPELVKPSVGADVMPTVARWLHPACDYVLQTYKRPKTATVERVLGGKTVKREEQVRGVDYCVRCEPHDVFITKFRVPRGSQFPDYIKDPSHAKILAAIRGELKE